MLLSGCSPFIPFSKEIKQKFTNKFEGKSTNINELLDISGYYRIDYLVRVREGLGNDKIVTDSSSSLFMFFEDGTYATNFDLKPGTQENDSCRNFMEKMFFGKDGDFAGTFGAYKIDGDMIKIQRTDQTNWNRTWSFMEEWYKIIDRKTLKIIYAEWLLDDDKNNNEQLLRHIIHDYSLAHFIKADSLPEPDCYLKEEKWMWQNENDWINYMEKIKERKKKHKH
jgi:hypothetical protein